MITISEIKVNDIVYLTGKIGKKAYSVEATDELKEALAKASNKFNAATTHKKCNKITADALELIKNAKDSDTSSLVTVLKGDLVLDKKTNKYHVISGGKQGKRPVHSFVVEKMIEANDKGLSPKPWLIFWVRLMRNKLFSSSPRKVDNFMKYLAAKYVDQDAQKELVEEGYVDEMAKTLATHDQISITEQGIIAAFKYVDLLTQKYVVIKNEETGEQEIVQKDRYERELTVDENSGKVTKDELVLPEIAEMFVFQPPIMGTGGDAFTSRDLEDGSDTPTTAHIIQVGKVHELPKGFDQVNCNDDSVGVKGLHLGGYYYVQGFGGRTSYLVDCLVAPEDVGAVCDLSRSEEGAIRCKRYMVTGGHFAVSKGMYHPSEYAALLDTEWETAKLEAIKNLEKKVNEAMEEL